MHKLTSIFYVKLNLRSLLYFIPVFATLNLYGQTFRSGLVKGRVIDEQSKELPFVSILLRHTSDSVIFKTSVTNDKGEFSFSDVIEGHFFLEAKMISYKSTYKPNITITQANPISDVGIMSLLPDMMTLREVVVRAQAPLIERRADRLIVNLNSSMTATSILELMDKLPGVTVNAQDVINLNGKPILVYMDGKRTPLTGDALASFLRGMSSGNIQKVELITNPSSKYDAAGSGGIINIIKKRDINEGLVGSLYTTYIQGEYGKSNGGITLNYKNKAYNVFFNTNFTALKYFIDSDSRYNYFAQNGTPLGLSKFTTNSIRNNQTITPTLGIDFYVSKSTTLSVSSSETFSGFKREGETFLEQYNSGQLLTGKSDLINKVDLNSKTNISNIHLLQKLDTLGQELTFDLDYSNFDNKSDLVNFDKFYNGSGTFLSDRNNLLDQDGRLNMYAFKGDYSLPLGKSANIETGWKSSYVESNNDNVLYNLVNNISALDPNNVDRFKYSENINALYFNFNKQYQKLSMQLGIRGEHTLGKGRQLQTDETFTNQYIKVFPSLSFDYKLSKNNGLTLNLNKRINRPTYENLNPLIRYINSANYIQGNSKLLPAVSYNSSLRYSFKNELFLTLSYDIGLREQISVTSQYDNSAFTTKPGNDRRSNYFSAMMSYSKPVTKWWSTNNSVQAWQQRYNSVINGFEIKDSGIPALSVSTFQSINFNDKTSLFLTVVYLSEYQSRNRITESNFYSNGGIRRKIFGNAGTIYIGLNDIFNTYNAGYNENSVLVTQEWNNSYDNRNILASFTYNFGKGRIKSVSKGTASEEERKRTSIKEN